LVGIFFAFKNGSNRTRTLSRFDDHQDDNRASAIVELKISTFANGNTVQYRIGTTDLNSAYTWNTAQNIEQNVNALMLEINKLTVTTDVNATRWWSNNASGTHYMELKFGQTGYSIGGGLGLEIGGGLDVKLITCERAGRYTAEDIQNGKGFSLSVGVGFINYTREGDQKNSEFDLDGEHATSNGGTLSELLPVNALSPTNYNKALELLTSGTKALKLKMGGSYQWTNGSTLIHH